MMSEPLLIHYTKTPLDRVRSIDQDSAPHHKSQGLWLSVEDGWGWRDWCEGEEWGLDALILQYEITLEAKAEILYLRSPGEIDDFTDNFGVGDVTLISNQLAWPKGFQLVNWLQVAERWQGIIIAPYQHSRRLDTHTFWYYGWDCSSGCIWDAKAIEKVERSARARSTSGG